MPTLQVRSILKSNLRISFSAAFDFLSFHTVWAISGLMRRNNRKLLDYLVGAGEQSRWNFEIERLGGFQIDNQLVPAWSLNWKITR